MAKWGHRFFHKFRDKVRLQKKVIDELVSRTDEEGVSRYFEEKEKLNDLLIQEEIYWKQRAKVFWLAEGDSNTKFFHAQASKRKRQNHIPYLINDAGERIDCHEDMCVLIKEYYEGVFARSNTPWTAQGAENADLISGEQNEKLVAELSYEEFTVAVKQMHSDQMGSTQHFFNISGACWGRRCLNVVGNGCKTVHFQPSLMTQI